MSELESSSLTRYLVTVDTPVGVAELEVPTTLEQHKRSAGKLSAC